MKKAKLKVGDICLGMIFRWQSGKYLNVEQGLERKFWIKIGFWGTDRFFKLIESKRKDRICLERKEGKGREGELRVRESDQGMREEKKVMKWQES